MLNLKMLKMEIELSKLIAEFTNRSGESVLTAEETAYATQVKFTISVMLDYPHKLREEQVEMIKKEFSVGRSHAYKLVADAMDIFPSIEKVNKGFERARVVAKIYKYLDFCDTKKNTRDGAQYLKLLIDILGLRDGDDSENAGTTVIVNVLKSDPDSLGVKLPENFDLMKFINEVERGFDRKRNTIDIEHTEVK